MNSEWTRFPELNSVLASFMGEVLDILGDWMIGAYVQGSFALNEGDEQSDCDFLVVLYEDPTPEQLGHLMLLHDAIPLRDGHWAKHLEGSYPITSELQNLDGLGREWWYVDHGSRSMQRSTHCNLEIVRWTMREHGITLSGPDPADLVDPVPPEAIRDRMRHSLQSVVRDLRSWATLDIAWVRRYLVATTCRILYTLATAEVTSKRLSMEWAITKFGSGWEPLLAQVIVDRSRGFVLMEAPRPGSVERSIAFVKQAQRIASTW